MMATVRLVDTKNSRIRDVVDQSQSFFRDLRRQSLLATADDVVKPGLSDEVLQRLALMRPPVEQGEAIIRWGKPAKFQITQPDQPTEINYTTIIRNVTNDPPEGAKMVWYDGYAATVEVIRVEQDGNPENWVDVERFLEVIFVGRDDGIFRGFNLRPLYQD